jgi:hypothetical protein
MKRFLALSLITLGLSFSTGAQEHTTSPQTKAQSPTRKPTSRTNRRRTRKKVPKPIATPVVKEAPWATFTSEAGRFSVLMPGTPTDKIATVDSEPGPYTTHNMTLRNPKNVFLIGWVDYDPSFNFDRQSEMEMNRDNFVQGVRATLVDSRAVTVDGFRVIEFTAETAERIYRSRIYIVGRRPYQIVIGSLKGEDDSVSVNRFLNSFKVNPKNVESPR